MDCESTTSELIDPSNKNDVQPKTKGKKSHGNRAMQRYRRKLRKQNMNQSITADIASVSLVNKVTLTLDEQIQAKKQQEQERAQAVQIIKDGTVNLVSKSNKQESQKKFKKKQTIVKKVKVIGSKYSSKRKDKELSIIKDTFDYSKIPDSVFYQMYSTVFEENEDLPCLSNTNEKIQFVRKYTSLIDRLSYVQLQELQWKYYHDIATKQNIWKHCFSKGYAAKYSVYHTYGRSKSLIEHQLKQITQHLEKSQNAIQELKVEIFSKCTQHDTCVSVMNKLSAIIYQFVQEKQKQLYHELEYKREILVLDATDHQLFQKFSDLQPNKAHLIAAKRVWAATKQQMLLEEDIACLQHRLTLTSSSSSQNSSNLLIYRMIDDIDINLNKLNHMTQVSTDESVSTNEIKRLQLLKKDIVLQAISTSKRLIQDLCDSIQVERNKFFVENRYMESTSDWQLNVLNTIDTRRIHMIERTNHIIQHKIKTIEL